MNKTTKIVGSIVAGVALIGAGFIGAAIEKPQIIEVPKPFVVNNTVVEYVDVEVPVPVEVPVEVMVEDEAFLSLVCDKLMFDDIAECKEEVKAEDLALSKALTLIKSDELFDFLDDEGFVEDEDEVRLIKVYDDFEDVEVLDSDFEDEEYEFKIKVRVEDEEAEEKFKAYLTVKVEEGEASFESVELEE